MRVRDPEEQSFRVKAFRAMCVSDFAVSEKMEYTRSGMIGVYCPACQRQSEFPGMEIDLIQ